MNEVLLDLAKTAEFNAASLLNALLKSLEDCGLEPNRILLQLYDGASVMTDKCGTVQKLQQENLRKNPIHTLL